MLAYRIKDKEFKLEEDLPENDIPRIWRMSNNPGNYVAQFSISRDEQDAFEQNIRECMASGSNAIYTVLFFCHTVRFPSGYEVSFISSPRNTGNGDYQPCTSAFFKRNGVNLGCERRDGYAYGAWSFTDGGQTFAVFVTGGAVDV